MMLCAIQCCYSSVIATAGDTPFMSEMGRLEFTTPRNAWGGEATAFTPLLAETGDGRLVAIENQYKTADHDHLTRGLAYAVASECAALVLIAEDHRDEFVSVADYLNQLALAGDRTGILAAFNGA